MGMSTHVIGFRPPDERWKKMKAAWDACINAGVDPPDELVDFFDGEPPDELGIEVELSVNEWADDHRDGYELRVNDIPDNITVIRFFNSY